MRIIHAIAVVGLAGLMALTSSAGARPKSVALQAKVLSYVKNSYHLDTDIGPDYFDVTTLSVVKPKQHVGRQIELHHQRLAAFTLTNAVLQFSVTTELLDGTNQLIRIEEKHIAGKTRLIEQQPEPDK